MASEESQDQWDSLAETLGTPQQPTANEPAPEQPSHQPAPRAAEKPRQSRPRRTPPSMFEPELVEPAEVPAEDVAKAAETVSDEELEQAAPMRAAKTKPDPEPPGASDSDVGDMSVGERPEIEKPRRRQPRGRRGKESESREPGISAESSTTEKDRKASHSDIEDPAPGEHAQPVNVDPEPAAAVPAAEGFFASGLALPDWFPFARKSPKQATPTSEKSPESSFDDDQSEIPDVTTSLNAESDDSLEPHADWLATPGPRRAEQTVREVDAKAESNEESREEEDSTQRRRRPRRRGRGRGRGDKTSEPKERGERQVSAPDDKVESAIIDDFVDDENDDDSDYDPEVSTSGEAAREEKRAASHKNIPSWQDAISGVVDGNIAKRGERQRTSGGRGDGRSRGGRPRGGRGRRKPT